MLSYIIVNSDDDCGGGGVNDDNDDVDDDCLQLWLYSITVYLCCQRLPLNIITLVLCLNKYFLIKTIFCVC